MISASADHPQNVIDAFAYQTHINVLMVIWLHILERPKPISADANASMIVLEFACESAFIVVATCEHLY